MELLQSWRLPGTRRLLVEEMVVLIYQVALSHMSQGWQGEIRQEMSIPESAGQLEVLRPWLYQLSISWNWGEMMFTCSRPVWTSGARRKVRYSCSYGHSLALEAKSPVWSWSPFSPETTLAFVYLQQKYFQVTISVANCSLRPCWLSVFPVFQPPLRLCDYSFTSSLGQSSNFGQEQGYRQALSSPGCLQGRAGSLKAQWPLCQLLLSGWEQHQDLHVFLMCNLC